MTRTSNIRLILGIGIVAAVCVFFLPPIAQDPDYHNFADRRAFFGVPNFCDVLSNAPFLIVGMMGLLFLKERWGGEFIPPAEKRQWLALFVALLLTGLGSAYYHWEPDNHRLAWDRLGIALTLMTLFAIIITERIHYTPYLFPALALAGVVSVFYWDYTEWQGMGDLRPYALVQLLPILMIPLICVLFPAPETWRLACAFGGYALAKLFECFDAEVFAQSGISGHTLKHLAAGMGAYALLSYLKHGKSGINKI